ncbi:MAG: hypothetical protein HY291_18965 [Planctomycetes bacterium]|nr:hypothetical protein [Planctomycetota bacterium]
MNIRTWAAPFVISLLLAGCGAGGGSSSAGGSSRDETYRAYGKNFGDLIVKQDFQSAYELCSSHLKKKMTLEQFSNAHKQAFKDYGQPAKFEVSLNFTDPELLKGQSGWPEGAARQARVFVNFFKDKNEDSATGDFSLGLNIVGEDGKDLVGAFDYGIH